MLLGIDENRYTRYERAEVEPDLSMLMKICETLGVTPNELLRQTNGELHADSGFAESSEIEDSSVDRLSQNSPHSSMEDPAKLNANEIKRRSLAWQLAREISTVETTYPHQMEQDDKFVFVMKKTSQLYSKIQADPFEFVANVLESSQVNNWDHNQQAKIAKLADSLIQVVSHSVPD